MTRTLLYTVQRVLEKLNLDPVNSISDSTDALLVSREAESTFYDLMTRAEWEEKVDLIEVNSVSDLNNPTALALGQEVHNIKSLRYDVTTADDKNKLVRKIQWLSPEDFLEKSYRLNTSNSNVVEVNYKDIPLLIKNDEMPNYYTSFDNKTLILDSYDAVTEDTLIGTKTICYGIAALSWVESDTFVIPLEDNLYPLYLSMLASACSIYMNSEVNQEDERRQARGISRMRREQIRTEMEYFPKFTYGRKGNGLV